MSVLEDNILLNDGREIINRLLKFISTIVIKSEKECDDYEDGNSYRHYSKYRKCFYKTSTFTDHMSNGLVDGRAILSDMDSFNITVNLNNIDYENPNELDRILSTNEELQKYLQKVRERFIKEYVDKNQYYRTLMGVPKDNSEYIKIIDRDNPIFETTIIDNEDIPGSSYYTLPLSEVSSINYPKTYKYMYEDGNIYNLGIEITTVPLHKITFATKPRTYMGLFIDGLFNRIKEIYPDYEYLKYLNKGIDIISARESENFDILWCDESSLEGSEIDYFYKVYGEITEYYKSVKYNKGLEVNYEKYYHISLMIILFSVFQRFYLTYLDKFSIRDYTKKDIFNILDSLNLSNLKDLDIKLLRRVVENIDTLLSQRGTNKILEEVFKLVAIDNNLSVRRYDIIKTHETDPSGISKFTLDKTYDKNVDLAFIDKVIFSSGDLNSSKSGGQIIGYKEFINSDPFWGGVGQYKSDQAIEDAIFKCKDQILKLPFNRLPTKYYGITSVINVSDIYDRFKQKLGLLVQFIGGFGSILGRFDFDNSLVTLFDLYNTMYYGHRIIEWKNGDRLDYDTIDERCWTFTNMIKLVYSDIEETTEIIENMEVPILDIDSEKGITSNQTFKIKDILKDYDLKDYVLRFPTVSGIDNFKLILDSYEENFEKYEKILYKYNDCTTLTESLAWKAILDYFTTNVSIEPSYSEYGSFESLISVNNSAFFEIIKEKIILEPDVIIISTYLKECLTAFKKYIGDIIGEPFEDTDFSSSVKIGEDISNLMKSFVSYFIELRDVDININLSDTPFNRIRLLDTFGLEEHNFYEEYILLEDKFGIEECYVFEDSIDLFYRISTSEEKNFLDKIEIDDEYSLEDSTNFKDRIYNKDIFNITNEINFGSNVVMIDRFKIYHEEDE